jgi:uncharacterized protein (TIGR03435 family)
VATIKQNTSIEGPRRLADQPGGRFIATRIALKTLISGAYGGPTGTIQISGGPAWIDSDLWDVEAKAPEGSVLPAKTIGLPPAMAVMLQSLLEDRFQLVVHKETKEMPIYELTTAKGNAKIKLSPDQTPATGPEPGSPPPQRGGPIPRGAMLMGRGNFEVTAISMEDFAKALGALYAGRTVVDRTGIQGLYDLALHWMPDALNTADSSGPSIFTAIQEQLGLKLESAKGPVEVLVIDRVQKPSEN